MDIQDAIKIAEPSLYNNLGHYNVCNFGGVGEAYHRPFVNQACHAQGRGKWSKEIEYYYTTVAKNKDGDQKSLENLLKLAEWIVSETSPWGKLTKGRQTKVLTDGKTVGYIMEVKSEDDLCLLMNMSIGGRVPQEYANAWKFMQALMDQDITMEEAYYLSAFFQMKSTDLVSDGGFASTSHSIIDDVYYNTERGPKFNFKRFYEKDPKPSKDKVTGGISWNSHTPINDVFKEANPRKFNLIQNRVKDSGAVVGRWTKTPGGKTVDSILKVWNDGYRKELLEHFAAAA